MNKSVVVILICFLIIVSSCTRKPEACITASVTTAKLGQLIIFTDCSTRAGDDWKLEFGDGKSIDDFNNAPLEHVYESPGTFNATYAVWTENKKKTDETTLVLVVQNPTEGEITGTWVNNKIEEYLTTWGLIDSWNPNDTLIFYSNGTYEDDYGTSNWELDPDGGEITLDPELFTITKLYDKEMILKNIEFGGYYLFYLKQI